MNLYQFTSYILIKSGKTEFQMRPHFEFLDGHTFGREVGKGRGYYSAKYSIYIHTHTHVSYIYIWQYVLI